MRLFVTGATGFIGSAVVRELLGAGHQVLGLARSDASAAALAAAGADAHRGSLDDLDQLRAGAAATDGVVHTAFVHDMANFEAGVNTDLRAVAAMGEALAGSNRPLVIASGVTGLTPGRVATEDSVPDPGSPAELRFRTEELLTQLAEREVRTVAVRLPPTVHGEGDRHGFVPLLIGVAREKGMAAYPGDGANRWAAVHRLDAARLFRLAAEHAPAGSRLHGVGDEAVSMRDIAERIGMNLGFPVASIPAEQAFDHFGWVGGVAALDTPGSSAITRKLLDWQPTHLGLLDDLDAGHYFAN